MAQEGPMHQYNYVEGTSYIKSKNVYLLNLIENLSDVRAVLVEDEVLRDLGEHKRRQLVQSLEECGNDVLCYAKNQPFSEAEIDQVANRLTMLFRNHEAIQQMVAMHLIPSGKYQLQADDEAGVWLANAWKQDANTLNHIIHVYAKGGKPNYPRIDSLGMNVSSSTYLANIQALGELVKVESSNSKLFFSTTLNYAMSALDMARMEHAGQFEPMHLTVNKEAYLKAKKVNWDEFDYPLILIPGAGTDNYLDSLSSGGVLRCRLAFDAFKKGMAPFILVSGGYVHPYKVQRNEAMEMKKYLLALGVPESAILMDPHARHTTTNMRNTARIMFSYGFPMNRPSITVTTPSQSNYIYAEKMQKRCMDELGYSPYKNGKRLSATTAEFYPSIKALQIDADEPLDP